MFSGEARRPKGRWMMEARGRSCTSGSHHSDKPFISPVRSALCTEMTESSASAQPNWRSSQQGDFTLSVCLLHKAKEGFLWRCWVRNAVSPCLSFTACIPVRLTTLKATAACSDTVYTCCGFGFGTSGPHRCIYETTTEAELKKLPCGWGSWRC